MSALLSVTETEFSADCINRLRLGVEDFIRQGGRVKDLDIERNRPMSGTQFAFIAVLPTIRSRHLWYRCSYCQRERKFGEGRLAFCGDLRLRFIGNDCWRKHVAKEAWADAKADFRTFKAKQRFDLVADQLGPVLSTLSRELRIYVEGNIGALKDAESFGGRLSRLIPELWQQLHRARRAGNVLVVERVLSEREREIQSQFDALTKSGSRTPGVKIERIHILQGTRILDDLNVVAPLVGALRGLQEASEKFKNTNWDVLSTRTFSKSLKTIIDQIENAVGAIGSAAMMRTELVAFFNPTHLQGIGRWGADHDAEIWLDGELTITERAIYLVSGRKTSMIPLIDPKELPASPDTSRIKVLLDRLS